MMDAMNHNSVTHPTVAHHQAQQRTFAVDTIDPIIVGDLPCLTNDGALVTHPTAAPIQTDKTDLTDIVLISNDEFLTTVFGGAVDIARPMVCHLSGPPSKPVTGGWKGQPWLPGKTVTEGATDNWYFTLASFNPDAAGTYCRQKSYFAGLHAIMLDDIGTKAADRSRLDGLPPSWLLETSPGNYQAGYVLAEPLTDAKQAVDLVEAIIAAGLCDKGANGPLARYARLPAAVNGKHTPPFACRLIEWRPEKRFTPMEIVDGLGLELRKATPKGAAAPAPVRDRPNAHNAVYLPRAEENPVIVALRERGLYRASLGDGKHQITCPWVDEHTDAIDSGTAYFEPTDTHPIGGFKCQHGHCAERHIGSLLDYLGVEKVAAKHRAIIRAIPGELSRVVDAAERELALTGRYFQRSGQIVSIFSDPVTAETAIRPVSPAGLLKALSVAAHWERFDGRSKAFAPTDPPGQYLNVLADTQNLSHLPLLKGLARQPYLRPDGTIMTTAGYDAATGMFGVFDEASFTMPSDPTREDAMAALAVLTDLLQEFAFASDSDRAAALAGILTAVIRPSLAQAPMFHVKAPQIASGKSYLTCLIAAFASQSPTPATSFPANEEECHKLLISKLIEAPAALCFDNLTTDLLPHKSLCSALTDEHVSGRILGASKTVMVGTRVLFLSSGNNVDPIRDMARRCVTIRLDPGCETPATREFRRRPVDEVKHDRGRYVSLALMVIRAWIVAGRPMRSCRSIASFNDWSDLVRQALLWLGQPDPAESIFTAMAVDPNRETLERLLNACWNVFGKTPMMVRDIVDAASRHSADPNCVELYEVISDIADDRGQISRTRLGWWIKRNDGRIVNDLRFVKAPTTRSAVQWQIESVASVKSVSTSVLPETVSTPPERPIILH